MHLKYFLKLFSDVLYTFVIQEMQAQVLLSAILQFVAANDIPLPFRFLKRIYHTEKRVKSSEVISKLSSLLLILQTLSSPNDESNFKLPWTTYL